MEDVLRSNLELNQRLRRLEDRQGLCSETSTQKVSNGARSHNVPDDTSTIATLSEPQVDRHDIVPLTHDISSYLEQCLFTSRVYQRTWHYPTDVSLCTSVTRTHAWFILSGLSLAEMSRLSVMALPLYADDLVNLKSLSPTAHSLAFRLGQSGGTPKKSASLALSALARRLPVLAAAEGCCNCSPHESANFNVLDESRPKTWPNCHKCNKASRRRSDYICHPSGKEEC